MSEHTEGMQARDACVRQSRAASRRWTLSFERTQHRMSRRTFQDRLDIQLKTPEIAYRYGMGLLERLVVGDDARQQR